MHSSHWWINWGKAVLFKPCNVFPKNSTTLVGCSVRSSSCHDAQQTTQMKKKQVVMYYLKNYILCFCSFQINVSEMILCIFRSFSDQKMLWIQIVISKILIWHFFEVFCYLNLTLPVCVKVDFEGKGVKFQGFVKVGSNAVDGLKRMFKWKHAKLFFRSFWENVKVQETGFRNSVLECV